MPLGIDPTVDYAFKKLFGDPENSDLLIHLLNAVLKPDSPIVDVQLLNPFNEKEFAEAKLTVLDIKARDASGAWYNVEMQSSAVGVLRRRLPYYNSLTNVARPGVCQSHRSNGNDWKHTTAARVLRSPPQSGVGLQIFRSRRRSGSEGRNART